MTLVTSTRLLAATVNLVAKLVPDVIGLRGRTGEKLVILDRLVGPAHGLMHLAEVLPVTPDVGAVVNGLGRYRRAVGGRHRVRHRILDDRRGRRHRVRLSGTRHRARLEVALVLRRTTLLRGIGYFTVISRRCVCLLLNRVI